MAVRGLFSGTDERGNPSQQALLIRLYALPIALGILLSFILTTWILMFVGVSAWTIAGLAAFFGSVLTVVLEEVMYDVG